MASKSPAAKPAPKKRSTRPKATATAKRAAPKPKARTLVEPAPVPYVSRRAIFIDVENTSSEQNLIQVLDHLQIDRKAQRTELTALGNWKSVGTRVARMLANRGAQLVHSAPAVGVRDWSDLWIAVAAGRWLATAAPGDVIDIVSDDRAFDAVGDAAAALGVAFTRTSYRTLGGAAHAPTATEAPARRGRRGGRGRRRGRAATPVQVPEGPAPSAAASPAREPAPPTAVSEEEAHAASHEQVRAALLRIGGETPRWINLDALANALKAAGFVRPPNSPRLITRLRRMKDVEVSPNGMVRLRVETAGAESAVPEPVPAPKRRPRRRGGRGRRRPATAPANDAAAPAPPAD